MFDSSTIITFLMASMAIIISPGPAQALSLANTLSGGKKAGILTVLGLNASLIVHCLAAALGLSAILATSATAFAVVKYLGAAYLIYLGIKTFIAKENGIDLSTSSINSQSSKVFIKAMITGILNPKVALFFLAFLPQFVDPMRGSVLIQFFILGGILGLLDIIYESALVLIAGAMTDWILRNKTFAIWRQRITGTVLIGLGLRLAFIQRN
jgi:threonine/homoserine/homoserine lactone efflux protein